MNLKVKAYRYKGSKSAHRWDCMVISDGTKVLEIRHGGRINCYPEGTGSFNYLFRAISKLSKVKPSVVRRNEGAVLELWEDVVL